MLQHTTTTAARESARSGRGRGKRCEPLRNASHPRNIDSGDLQPPGTPGNLMVCQDTVARLEPGMVRISPRGSPLRNLPYCPSHDPQLASRPLGCVASGMRTWNWVPPSAKSWRSSLIRRRNCSKRSSRHAVSRSECGDPKLPRFFSILLSAWTRVRRALSEPASPC